MLPILHFSGKFRFSMPGYNNDPRKVGVAFDPDKPREEVLALCRCDPSRYFELDVEAVAHQVSDGGGAPHTTDDPALGLPVRLSGHFPDVSPSAVCSQLHAGRLSVGGSALVAGVRKACQSVVRLNVRSEGFSDETVAGHLDALVDVSSRRQGPTGSRFFSELADADVLRLHLHLNRYNGVDASPPEEPLTGDVFGYLCPVERQVDAEVAPPRRRKLVAHPGLPDQGWAFDTYLAAPPPPRPYPPHWIDIEGFYEVVADGRALAVHYLDFVPYLDRQRTTPPVDHYVVRWQSPTTTVELGEFSGTHEEMARTAGVVVLALPPEVDTSDGGELEVHVVRGGETVPLVVETAWDLVLEGDRGFALASAGAATISARVYHRNRPVPGHPVHLVGEAANRKSPVVARFTREEAVTDESGRVQVTVQASDLTAMGDVADPVTGGAAGSLAWDRYYGNFLYLKIDNPLRRNPWRQDATEVVELAVRVLHRVEPAEIPAQPSFERDVKPLFAYQVRYFPWLHVREVAGRYVRLFDLEDLEDMRSLAPQVVSRLTLPDHDPLKMPRSRDFPVGGAAVVQRWIDTGMHP